MRFRNLCIVGVILFIVSLPYTSLLIFFSVRANPPEIYDHFYFISKNSNSNSNYNYHPLTDVQLSRTVIAIKESVSLKVILSNNSNKKHKVEVMVNAPTFEAAPSQQTKEINVPVGKDTANLVWILTPKEEGFHEIGIQTDLDAQTKGILVTNVLGLTPKQAEILSLIGTFIGGPITIGGLMNQWTKYKSKRKKIKEEEERLKAQESLRKSKTLVRSLFDRLRGKS